MSRKMKLLVVAVLAVLIFGGSFAVFYTVGASERKARSLDPNRSPDPLMNPTSPVAKLEKLSLTEHELEKLILEVRRKLAECETRQSSLDQQAQRIEIAQQDLKHQAEEIENLRLSLVAPLKELREARLELERTRILVAKEERLRLQNMARMFESMDPLMGAQTLTTMLEGGQADDAARIVYFMDDRRAAKLVGEITDKTIAAKLLERVKRVRPES